MREGRGMTELKPEGSLALPPARELIAVRAYGGAYDLDGNVVEDTLRLWGEESRRRDRHRLPERLADFEVVEAREEPVVWAGGMLPHYGHFLIESTARLWPVLPGGELEGLPVVFATPLQAKLAFEWLDAFGARRLELPERGAVRFARMYVPQPAWQLAAWAAPEMRRIHLQVRQNLKVPTSPRRDVLWLSRSRLQPRRVAYDECLLEWILHDQVEVVHPERMTLAEQVGALESCEAVVGVLGSAFHTLLMTADPPRCVFLCPSADTTHGANGRFQAAYGTQDEMLGTDGEFVYALEGTGVEAERLRTRNGVFFPAGYRLLIPEVLVALSETVLPGLMEDPRVAAFADPGESSLSSLRSEIELAAFKVLLDPLSIEARTTLGRAFEAEGLSGCAREQLTMAADLAADRSRR